VADQSDLGSRWTVERIRELVPAEGWTIDGVRAVVPGAELLDPKDHYVVADVPRTDDYEVLEARVIINLEGYCLVQSSNETSWWMGHLDATDGSIVCWGRYGEDLADAIWSL
jgi:hypothetical protein